MMGLVVYHLEQNTYDDKLVSVINDEYRNLINNMY